MAYAFDTLGYSKALREAGIAQDHAEAHAAAAREFIMVDLVTKEDLRTALELQTLQMTVRLGGLIAARFRGDVRGARRLDQADLTVGAARAPARACGCGHGPPHCAVASRAGARSRSISDRLAK